MRTISLNCTDITMRKTVLLLSITLSWLSTTTSIAEEKSGPAKILPFGRAGKFKMLYDARQRPQSVFLKGRLYIVYNGDAKPTSNGKGIACPMLITYEPESRSFSQPVRLGKRDSDHHYSPIVWADKNDHLHVLHGCHKTPGTHLISEQPVHKGSLEIAWKEGPQIAPKISYPAVFRVSGDRELICYSTDGHTSSWTYRISNDNGQTWIGPESDAPLLWLEGRRSARCKSIPFARINNGSSTNTGHRPQSRSPLCRSQRVTQTAPRRATQRQPFHFDWFRFPDGLLSK